MKRFNNTNEIKEEMNRIDKILHNDKLSNYSKSDYNKYYNRLLKLKKTFEKRRT